MTGGPDDLYVLCAEYLEVCRQAVALAPGGPIERCFVSPGPPAWDCPEQLTVHAGGPVIADTAPLQPPLMPGHRIQQTGTLNLVTMTATVLRCAPVQGEYGEGLEVPAESDLDTSARVTLGDVWTIWMHLKTLKKSGVLWAPNERELILDPAVVLNTMGGVAGWQVQVRVGLGGFSTS